MTIMAAVRPTSDAALVGLAIATPHPVRPVLRPDGRPALVDGHPVCRQCGRPAGPLTGGWQHVRARTKYPPRVVPAPTWRRLHDLGDYREFAARFPALVGEPDPVTLDDWTRGMPRLASFRRLSRRLSRVRPLGPQDNPYLTLVQALLGPDKSMTPGLARLLDLPRIRRHLVARFAWAIPDEPALAALADLGPLVDVGAGTGYWAAMLTARGADVVAVDRNPPGPDRANAHHLGGRCWTEVRNVDAVAAVRSLPHRTLLLCWPPIDDDGAYRAVRAYAGDLLVYIGEPAGGATGTARLERELALNWEPRTAMLIPTWPALQDRLTVYGRRAAVRIPLTERDRCHQCGRFIATGSTGRCDRCRRSRPAALTLRYGSHLLEYPASALAAMPPAIAAALARSPHRVAEQQPNSKGR